MRPSAVTVSLRQASADAGAHLPNCSSVEIRTNLDSVAHMRLRLVALIAFAIALVLAALAIADQTNSGLATACGLAAIIFAVVGVRLLFAAAQRR